MGRAVRPVGPGRGSRWADRRTVTWNAGAGPWRTRWETSSTGCAPTAPTGRCACPSCAPRGTTETCISRTPTPAVWSCSCRRTPVTRCGSWRCATELGPATNSPGSRWRSTRSRVPLRSSTRAKSAPTSSPSSTGPRTRPRTRPARLPHPTPPRPKPGPRPSPAACGRPSSAGTTTAPSPASA